jgi:hypothetical protein
MSKDNFAGRVFGALAFTAISAGSASAQIILQNRVSDSSYAASSVPGQSPQNLLVMHIVSADQTPNRTLVALDVIQLPPGNEIEVTARSPDANFATVRKETTDIGVAMIRTTTGFPNVPATDFIPPQGWSIANVKTCQSNSKPAGPNYPNSTISCFHVSMVPYGPG